MPLTALLSVDIAPNAGTIRAAVVGALGGRTSGLLLTDTWYAWFRGDADFQRFGDAMEAIHALHPGAFDYVAVLFNPNQVLIAPNPDRRKPTPVATESTAPPRARTGMPRAAARPARRSPDAFFRALERLHAFSLPANHVVLEEPAPGAGARAGARGAARPRKKRRGRGTGGRRGRGG